MNLDLTLNELKKNIIKEIIDSRIPNINKIKLIFEFLPYINKGYKAVHHIFDSNDKPIISTVSFGYEFDKDLLKLISVIKQEHDYNTIVFETIINDYDNAKIEISLNPVIEDTFQKNLPKKYKSKTIPWWRNPDEIKGLL